MRQAIRWAMVLTVVAVGLAQNPAVTSVIEAAGQIPPGFPTYGLPPGGVLRIAGSNLGPQSAVQNYPAFPLDTQLGGASVKVRAGGREIDALMMSASATLILAILPSDTPLGNGTLTVTNQGRTSAAVNIRVANAVGIFTLNARGTGPALVLNSRFEPVTIFNPARPDEPVLLLLNTTGDAVTINPAADAGPRIEKAMRREPDRDAEQEPRLIAPGAFKVQDRTVPPLLFGSLFPGLSFFVFRVPTGILGCHVPIRFERDAARSVLPSNVASISIALPANRVCDDPVGMTMTQRLDLLARAERPATPAGAREASGRDELFTDRINRLEFVRDYGFSRDVFNSGGSFSAFIAKAFYEEDAIILQFFKDSFQTSYGCYLETNLLGVGGPAFARLVGAGFLNLGPQVMLRTTSLSAVESLPRLTTNNVYQFIALTNIFGGAFDITVDVPGAGSILAYRPVFKFPFALPTSPYQVRTPQLMTTGQTINSSQDFLILFQNLPVRPNHVIKAELTLPAGGNRAGAIRGTCIYPAGPEIVIPAWLLSYFPTSSPNTLNMTLIYMANRPMETTGIPERIGIVDAYDRIFTQLTGIPFVNNSFATTP